MRFKQWLAKEVMVSPLQAPSPNPVADKDALNQAVQATLQSPEIPKIASQNLPPPQLMKSIIPVAQKAVKINPANRNTPPVNVTPMDITRSVIPQLQMPKRPTNPMNQPNQSMSMGM